MGVKNMNLLMKVLNQYQKFTFKTATKNIIYNWQTREKYMSFGSKNPDKRFYVIRSLADTSKYYIGPRHNLMANYFYVLSHLANARLNGWIPIVDQLNYPVYISQPRPIHGSYNAWEYFWEQPSAYSLEEVYKSKHVILSKQNWYWQWDMGYDVVNYINQELVSQYHDLSCLVPLNKQMKSYCQEVKDNLAMVNERVLGVSVRITGHSANAFYQGPGHPKQPSAEEMVHIVETYLDLWNMKKVFLATDSDYAVMKFQEAFGNHLITMSRLRSPIGYDQKKDSVKPMYAVDHIIQTTKDYLAEMEALASCTGLLGSVSSGLRYAVVRNNGKYEKIKILDYGRFNDERRRGDKVKISFVKR